MSAISLPVGGVQVRRHQLAMVAQSHRSHCSSGLLVCLSWTQTDRGWMSETPQRMWTAVAYSQEPPPSWWTLLQALNYVASDVLYQVQVPCWRHLCQMGRAQLYSPS